MNMTLAAAAALCAATGLVHSVLGERMIFANAEMHDRLPARFRGIIRASWHATTLLGFGLAAVMLHHAASGAPMPLAIRLGTSSAIAAAGAAVLIWTAGRHPGWIALGIVAGLCLMA
ncbi:MAG: hypothetical protein ACRCTI_07690 [Beijerinckiaceae bacterium]